MTFFPTAEFVGASQRPPSGAERALLPSWRSILDPAREWYGGPVRVTSWLRLGGGAHASGDAVDVQPVSGGEGEIRALAEYFAALHLPPQGSGLAQVIYEPPASGQRRGHVHLARRLVQGATPGFLVESTNGEGEPVYTLASIPRVLGRPVGIALAAYAFARILSG